jgi:hypothetical protein
MASKTFARYRQALAMSKYFARKLGHVPCRASIGKLALSDTGLCHICGDPKSKQARELHMDHDHKTGRFRGWLCARCNVGIGKFEDSPALLLQAIEYLTKK